MFLNGCSSVFYQPDRYQHYPPEKFGYAHEEFFLTTADNVKLLAWFFPATAKTPKGTIVQFHGNAENMSSHYLSLKWITERGYNLFAFDYRGYGRSEGEPSQRGTYLDAITALAKAYELNRKTPGARFVVYGQSLGGVIAMRALADFSKERSVQYLVLDSTFLSYKRVARRVLSGNPFTWLFSPLAYVLISDEYGAEDALRSNRIPLLVIHDTKDEAVSFANGEEIFELASQPKTFWRLEHGGHVQVFREDAPENRAHFVQLLDAKGPQKE